VADEPEDKPEGETPAEEAAEPARETAVGHQVVEPEPEPEKPEATEVFFSRDEPAAAAPQPAAAPPQPQSGTSPAAADRVAADSHDSFTDKPELFVAGAFVAAFVAGKLLKKITGSGD
jgi:hypothetical protein